MKKRIFITGGTGFLGGHLLSLSTAEWEVFAAFRSRVFKIPGVTWIEVDLTDKKNLEAAFKTIRPDAVIHAAAMSHIDWCEENRDEAHAVNAESSAFLAALCRESGSRMVFVSSDMVFDGEKGMYAETDPVHPVNYYGETKCTAEAEVGRNCPDSVCARSALIYGEPVYGGTSFAHQMVLNLRSGKEVTLFTDQYRSPVSAENLARALLELAGTSFTGILHLGGSERIGRYAFGLLLAELNGLPKSLVKPVRMEEFPPAAPRPKDVSLNVSKAEGLLKTKPQNCREGLQSVRSAAVRVSPKK
jgi:dTDP-4-dehydrorhamnose reductase